MTATEAASDPKPSRSGRLLALVRALIDYGKQLVTTLRNNPPAPGAGDLALLLVRITGGLLRAEALEARIIRGAPQLDAASVRPRTPSPSRSPAVRTAAIRPAKPIEPIDLPTAEQIVAEVRRRPIGAVLADICRDLGIWPNHPLWPELRALIIRHGGNLATLVTHILDQAFPLPAARAAPAASPISPPARATGPP